MKLPLFERCFFGVLHWWARHLPGPLGEKAVTYVESIVQWRLVTNHALTVIWYDDESHESMMACVEKGMLAVKDTNADLVQYYTRQLEAIVAARVIPQRRK